MFLHIWDASLGTGYWGRQGDKENNHTQSPITNHQSPVPSAQSPIPNPPVSLKSNLV
ncbi:MAG: hypothetical protein V7L11_13105 [Nostoc sp.]|uniref:hypothetical protein n=1 Tax=Nostoc sp. TaxID=1180 RepID=UPI002FF4B8B8